MVQVVEKLGAGDGTRTRVQVFQLVSVGVTPFRLNEVGARRFTLFHPVPAVGYHVVITGA